MAVNDSYATPAVYRQIIRKNDSGDDGVIQADIEAISRYVDKKLHRYFSRYDEAVENFYTTRSYRSARYTSPAGWGFAEAENPWLGLTGDNILEVDDIAAITDLEIVVDTDHDGDFSDETPLSASDYVLLPRNALTGPEPNPYTSISLVRNGIWRPASEVRITAMWGWPAIPAGIQRAVCHLTGILRLETPRATRVVNTYENPVEASDEAQMIIHNLLKTYKRQPRGYR